MARMLSNAPNKITFDDKLSGSKLTLLYRMPTTEERVDYSNRRYQFARTGKADEAVTEIRQEYGLKILTGFEKGAFTKPGPDGKAVSFSFQEGDP